MSRCKQLRGACAPRLSASQECSPTLLHHPFPHAGVRDDFYNRQFGKHDLLAPVVGALLRSLRRGNAVSSAVFELLHEICDTAAPHLVDYAVHSFRPIWDTVRATRQAQRWTRLVSAHPFASTPA